MYRLCFRILADLFDLLPFLLLRDPQGFKLLPCFHYLPLIELQRPAEVCHQEIMGRSSCFVREKVTCKYEIHLRLLIALITATKWNEAQTNNSGEQDQLRSKQEFFCDNLDGNEEEKEITFLSLVDSGPAKSNSGTGIQTKW